MSTPYKIRKPGEWIDLDKLGERLEDEINSLRARLDKLELGNDSAISFDFPSDAPICPEYCDAEYTGLPHIAACPFSKMRRR